MSSKRIYIENFRNIGFNPYNEENNACEFILNRSINPDYIGDLVILLGKNNSGKSNFLYALERLNSFKLVDDDYPKFFWINQENWNLNNMPCIYTENKIYLWNDNLIYDDANLITSVYSFIANIEDLLDKKYEDLDDYKNIRSLIETLLDRWHRIISSTGQINQQYIRINELSLIYKILNKLNMNDNMHKLPPWIQTDLGFIRINEFCKNTASKVLNLYLDCNFINLENYKNEIFTVESKEDKIKNNDFFLGLFNYVDQNISEFIKNRFYFFETAQYEKLNEQDKLLDKISDEFNKLFNLYEDNNFKFRFRLIGCENLKFKIDLYDKTKESIIALSQDYHLQSTGFKWFFNFFFNFWSKQDFKYLNEKIILLDEPGNSFSKLSLSNLRNFLKNIAYQYGITFVLTTHRSDWISLDYLEELRIVKNISKCTIENEENSKAIIADIENNFTFQSDKAEIWLINIIKAVEANIIDNCDESIFDEFGIQKTFVFVEGISDYLFLTGIKINLLNSNELGQEFNKKLKHTFFIPLNGLKRLDKNNKFELHKYLNIFQSKKCFILVDDDKAGLICKDKLK
ncbi:MAG: AAA family ATPase, partial [Mycoplasmataceae bacterium]|nr:AAA family ATPase [Mycoplasmataceae bacterium]